MSTSQNGFGRSANYQICPFWRGHLFLFDHPQAPIISSQQGNRLLSVLFFLEVVVRPLATVAARWLVIDQRIWWPFVQVVTLITLGLWLVMKFAKVPPSTLGLYSWSRWSKTEKLYFLQIVPISIIVFSLFTAPILKMLWVHPSLLAIALFIFVQQMIWGFYQEFLYRGLLQTELVRRWGTLRGILASNLVFTFGPLHAYHFWTAKKNVSHLWIFAAIFGIGLLFAILFRRSGNLWIIGTMHGLGDWFIDGLTRISHMT